MTEKQGTDMFNFYNNAFKAWSDILKSGTTKTGIFPMSLGSVARTSKTVFRNMTSSMEIYNAWLKGADDVVEQGFEVGRKFVRGEQAEAETSQFTKTLKDSFDSVSDSVMESVEDTPFEGIRQIDRAVKKSLESLGDEHKIFETFLQEVFNYACNSVNLFRSSNGNRKEIFSNMLKGNSNGAESFYKAITDSYETMANHLADSFKLFSATQPWNNETVEGAIGWAKKSAGISVSWLDISLKQHQELRRVSMEFCKIVDDTLKQGNSLEEFYEKWVESMDKARLIYVNDPQSYKIISEFINKNTDFIKSTIELYRNSNDMPCAANGYNDSSSRHAEAV